MLLEINVLSVSRSAQEWHLLFHLLNLAFDTKANKNVFICACMMCEEELEIWFPNHEWNIRWIALYVFIEYEFALYFNCHFMLNVNACPKKREIFIFFYVHIHVLFWTLNSCCTTGTFSIFFLLATFPSTPFSFFIHYSLSLHPVRRTAADTIVSYKLGFSLNIWLHCV